MPCQPGVLSPPDRFPRHPSGVAVGACPSADIVKTPALAAECRDTGCEVGRLRSERFAEDQKPVVQGSPDMSDDLVCRSARGQLASLDPAR